MPAKIIDGKQIANNILADLKKNITKLDKRPGLAAIVVGDDPASILYSRLKEKACQEVGINFHSYFLEKNLPPKKIMEVIEFLNQDDETDGILVQLPLPNGYDTEKIIKKINPEKDVDGFHPQTNIISPNILGIIELIKSTGTNLKGKNITVLANSKIFAKPFKKLLPQTKISYLSPEDSNLKSQTQNSDILIVALGEPKFIKPDMIKGNAILIDVGINKVNDKIVGDIDPACDKKADWRSPVPGGVGPMTVAMLLQNLVKMAN